MRRAISRRLVHATRKPGWVGNSIEGNPSGVRNSMSAPSEPAARLSEVKVRTTPLTCGCQASVAIRIRIGGCLVDSSRRDVVPEIFQACDVIEVNDPEFRISGLFSRLLAAS